MKGVPIPVSFAVMLAAIVALTIFFGAWVVSVDAEQRERSLSFSSIAGGGVNPDAGSFNPSLPTTRRTPAAQEFGESKADTWWGKTLIFACPLH